MTNHPTCDQKELIRRLLLDCGASAVGFARAERVGEKFADAFDSWLKSGFAGELDYMARYRDIRLDPARLLDGAKTVISLAFSYRQPRLRHQELPHISRYAYGLDYHDVVRARLRPAVETLRKQFGGDYRICVDSAPIPERYWAMRAGIGSRGLNGTIIIDGLGSFVFLTEILTTLSIIPDEPSHRQCLGCRRCLDACPTAALCPDSSGRLTLDASRCLSALTIEHKGPWTDAQLAILSSPRAADTLFGCDICQQVCPHNNPSIPTQIEEFLPDDYLLSLTAHTAAEITDEDFRIHFRHTPFQRGKAEALRRNARRILSAEDSSGIDKR